MRTEQPTKCFVPLQNLSEVMSVTLVEARLTPVMHYLAFESGSCVVVLCVRISVTFHLMFVRIVFSSVWVAEWPPFGNERLT